MSVDISRLAYALRKASEGTSHPLRHGHALELVAAGLGYGSLAAYKAAVAAGDESADLAGAAHVVLQPQAVFARATELTPMAPSMTRLEMVGGAFKECLPELHLWKDENQLYEALAALVDSTTYNHEETSGQMAVTNNDGIREIYLPLHFSLAELPQPGDPVVLEIVGHIHMEPSTEKPYWGHKIDILASLTVERVGRVAIARPDFVLESAKLDYNWSGDDESEPGS